MNNRIISIIFISIYFHSFTLNFKCNYPGDVMTFMKVQADTLSFITNSEVI